eukprot:5238026-Amphidinium_carterae.1
MANAPFIDAASVAPPFIEVFAHEARLSRHMKEAGFCTLALDVFRSNVRYESAVTFVDLASPGTATRLLDLLAETGSG